MTRAAGRCLAALALAATLAASGASSQAAPTRSTPVVAHPADFMMGPGCGASSS